LRNPGSAILKIRSGEISPERLDKSQARQIQSSPDISVCGPHCCRAYSTTCSVTSGSASYRHSYCASCRRANPDGPTGLDGTVDTRTSDADSRRAVPRNHRIAVAADRRTDFLAMHRGADARTDIQATGDSPTTGVYLRVATGRHAPEPRTSVQDPLMPLLTTVSLTSTLLAYLAS
jgi:hypothetical protein